MIQIDSVWQAVEPLDLWAGTDTPLARVIIGLVHDGYVLMQAATPHNLRDLNTAY